jgi:hypothetical protein
MTADQKLHFGYCVLAIFMLLSIYPAKLALVQGIDDTIWDLVFGGGDTVFASGYSDTRFLRIRKGMTLQEVKFILGQPLDVYPVDYSACCDMGMRWTRSAHDSSYRVRVLLFKNGVVVEKHAEFYVD